MVFLDYFTVAEMKSVSLWRHFIIIVIFIISIFMKTLSECRNWTLAKTRDRAVISLQVNKYQTVRSNLDLQNTWQVLSAPPFVLWCTERNSGQSKGKWLNGLERMTHKKSLKRLNMYSLTNQQLSGGRGRRYICQKQWEGKHQGARVII